MTAPRHRGQRYESGYRCPLFVVFGRDLRRGEGGEMKTEAIEIGLLLMNISGAIFFLFMNGDSKWPFGWVAFGCGVAACVLQHYRKAKGQP